MFYLSRNTFLWFGFLFFKRVWILCKIGTPWSDGTEGVTQCPILPGETFKYQFVVDRVRAGPDGFVFDFFLIFSILEINLQAGTYLYHAHYGMQRQDGLYGSIVVWLPEGQLEPFSYDHDRNLILTDWYHKSSHEHATGLATPDPGFQWVGEPDVNSKRPPLISTV